MACRATFQAELASGALVPLHEPEDPPINTAYLVQRPGRPTTPTSPGYRT
ncbi:hypothetical protein STANM309S_00673 [Streptomyces tanashiensis]